MTEPIAPDLLARIRSARSLPSPPAVTVRLIELGENPNIGLDVIIDVLQTDAALCARLLRLANSPLYARRRRTENLRQAVTMLGVDAVLTAALSLTLLTPGPTAPQAPPGFARACWRRSVYSAVCAQTLAQTTGIGNPGDAFLGGLLQDIGVQVLLRLEPDTYASIPADCTHEELVAAEIETLGADHAAVGAALLDAWRLPDRFVDAVRASHELAPASDLPILDRLISVSGSMADGLDGDRDAMERAANAADATLRLGADRFQVAIDAALETLPDVAGILRSEAPDATVIAEMAQDVLVNRLVSTQSATEELHEQLAAMTRVATTLRQENELDPLTGLSNRRHLDDVLAREYRIAREHGFPLSILFLDLDDFKKVNDRYGHGVGDDLLIQAAQRIAKCFRDADIVGRYGGEEFLAVLPGAPAGASNSAADRLVNMFDSRPFALGSELALHQTISVGVATLDESSSFADLAELVHAADVALYDAKRSGKNRWRRSDLRSALGANADLPLPASLRGRT